MKTTSITVTEADPTFRTGRTASEICAAAGVHYSGIVLEPHIPYNPTTMTVGETYAVKTHVGFILAEYEGGGVVQYINPHNV